MNATPNDAVHNDADALVARLRAAGCVFAEQEAALLLAQATTAADLEAMAAARVGGLPLEHVLGWAEFCGLRVAVDRGVFVPRPRSEYLVEVACAAAAPVAGRPVGASLVVVDLCCGSGALGLAVAARLRGDRAVDLHAADVDPAAVDCARRNLVLMERAGTGHAYVGDLFTPLPDGLRGHVDVLVANVPYVPSAEVALMPAEAREHERLEALDGGPDGLDVLRRLASGAPQWLTPGGCVLVETSAGQAPAALAAFTAAGLESTVRESDEFDATVLIGISR